MKHDWNNVDDYLYQHERRLEDYSFFIPDYNIDIIPINEPNQTPLLRISMTIKCNNGVILSVYKTAEIRSIIRRGNLIKQAKTVDYSYNAFILGKGNIFRYDNAHIHPGHSTPHHKHVFNPPDKEVEDSPFPINEDEWPNMHEVINELIRDYS